MSCSDIIGENSDGAFNMMINNLTVLGTQTNAGPIVDVNLSLSGNLSVAGTTTLASLQSTASTFDIANNAPGGAGALSIAAGGTSGNLTIAAGASGILALNGAVVNVQGAPAVSSSRNIVVQASSITTAVTSNGSSVSITTVSSTVAAGASANFTLNNSSITTSSVLLVSVSGYGGSTGVPYVYANGAFPRSGSVVLTLCNVAPSAALNGVVNISVLVA